MFLQNYICIFVENHLVKANAVYNHKLTNSIAYEPRHTPMAYHSPLPAGAILHSYGYLSPK